MKIKLKQAIIVRTHFEMSKGTFAAQVVHAAVRAPENITYCICQNAIMNGFMEKACKQKSY